MEDNIKKMLAVTLCFILFLQAVFIVLYNDKDLMKILLIEIFAVFNIMIGYYWGSSKGSKDKEKTDVDKELDRH